ncbi:MAG: SpoIIE family protein phosphatase, partial [Smithella sp.]
VNEQVKRAIITKEEAAKSEVRNVLTKALGIREEMEADLDELTMFGDDILLLCSDGLSTMVTDDAAMDIISFLDAAAVCDSLIDAANKKGGKDNITVVIGYVKKEKWYSTLFKFMEFFRR